MYYLPNDLLMACILVALWGLLLGFAFASGQSLFGYIQFRLVMWNYHRRRARLGPTPTKEQIEAWENFDRLYPDAEEGAAEEMQCGSEECRANCGETAEKDLQQRIDAHLEAARAAHDENCAGCEEEALKPGSGKGNHE